LWVWVPANCGEYGYDATMGNGMDDFHSNGMVMSLCVPTVILGHAIHERMGTSSRHDSTFLNDQKTNVL
jgi:hypothetical protein